MRPLGLTLTSQDLNSPGLGKATTGQPWKLQNTGILLVPGTEFLKPKPFQTTPRRIRLPPERRRIVGFHSLNGTSAVLASTPGGPGARGPPPGAAHPAVLSPRPGCTEAL